MTTRTDGETGIDRIHRRWPRLALAGIIVSLVAWHVAMLTWGPTMPFGHDELNFLQEALRLPAEQKLSSYGHGPLLYELVAFLEAGYYAVLRLTGSVQTTFDFLVEVQTRLSPLYEASRILVAVAGIAVVVQVYRLGVIFGGPATGALAALLCATNFTFLAMTSQLKEDAFYWLFLLLFLELAWKTSEQQSRRAAAWAGVALGCAMAAKYFAVFAAIFLLLPAVRSNDRRLREALILGLIMGVTAAATLLMLFPFLITDTDQVRNSIRILNAGYTTGNNIFDHYRADIGGEWTLYAYLRHHLPNLFGWIVPIFAGVEIVRRIVREPKGPILLLTAPLLQFLFIGLRTGFSLAYFAFPLALMFFILAASWAVHAASGTGGTRWRWSAAWILVAVVALDGAFLPGAAKYGVFLTGPETRLLARDIIVSKALPGDCVLINAGITGDNIYGPPLVPANPSPGSGAFTSARVIASQQMAGPHFELRILDTVLIPPQATEGCEWLVIGRRGQEARIDHGTGPVTMVQPIAPAGYTRVAAIDAFPEQHSIAYPFPSTLDYDSFRATSITRIWRERAMGMSFEIYHLSSAP